MGTQLTGPNQALNGRLQFVIQLGDIPLQRVAKFVGVTAVERTNSAEEMSDAAFQFPNSAVDQSLRDRHGTAGGPCRPSFEQQAPRRQQRQPLSAPNSRRWPRASGALHLIYCSSDRHRRISHQEWAAPGS